MDFDRYLDDFDGLNRYAETEKLLTNPSPVSLHNAFSLGFDGRLQAWIQTRRSAKLALEMTRNVMKDSAGPFGCQGAVELIVESMRPNVDVMTKEEFIQVCEILYGYCQKGKVRSCYERDKYGSVILQERIVNRNNMVILFLDEYARSQIIQRFFSSSSESKVDDLLGKIKIHGRVVVSEWKTTLRTTPETYLFSHMECAL